VIRRPTALLIAAALLLSQAALPREVAAADPADGSIVTSSGRVLPPMPEELNQPSIHAQMLADEGAEPITFTPGGAPTVVLDDGEATAVDGVEVAPGTFSTEYTTSALPNGLRKEVLGFLPYWLLTDTALSYMNYNLVSTIAYFSVGADKYGNLIKGTSSAPSSGWSGWNSARMTQVLDRAHSNGVKVVLTVTMMAWNSTGAANMAYFLGSTTNRARLVTQVVDAVRSRGADGVNLDFEPVAASQRANYTAFVKQLKKGLADAGVGSYLTVCVTAGAATWSTGYDVAGLTASGGANQLFVMGYDYNWSGSSRAGGVAPIRSPYTIDVDGTMNDFLAETSGSKVIWGVPYYGREWPTTSSQLNGITTGGASSAYHYTGHKSRASQYGRLWDDVGKVPWYRFQSGGTWWQGYYDDPQSLGVKYDLVNSRGFAGTGMWTLLMDQGTNDLWKLLASKFVTDTAPPVGGVSLMPASLDAQAVQVSWKVTDYASGVDRYNVQARWVGSSTWTTWLTGTEATSGWFGGDAGKTYQFRVQAIDLKGNAQPWVTVKSKPAAVSSGAFAAVTTGSLNVRSGAGTSFGIVDALPWGSRVYVLQGPVSASGYQWYRVQYGFAEWPSSDYALIGWSAAGGSNETYLAPADPPTQTRLNPFVSDLTVSPSFLPYGTGPGSVATASYRLAGAVSSARLDVLSSSGALVRSLTLGPQSAGQHSATWNGRRADDSLAAAGRYLLRIVVTDTGGTTHVGPTAGFGAGLLDRFGTTLKLSPFTDIASSPFKADIEWLYGQGITRGCSDTAYCPADPIVREHMATFLARTFGLPPTSIDFFTDDNSSQHENAINSIAAARVTLGCAPSRFCPTANVTRGQMASFIARALDLPATSVNYFDDDDGSTHEAEINSLAAAGITSGCGPRSYCVDDLVTREQMAAFLHRARTS
jgi:spore germination protein YaaH